MYQEKIIETNICAHCRTSFDITDVDRDFLTRLTPTIAGKKFELPFPTECPKCRKVRRYAWRNDHKIFKRKCDATGKELISLFPPETLCPVYESDYWYSDKWDAYKYGRDFDFSRSFFEQWGELKKVVPMPGKIISPVMENSDYSDNCGNLKNCYLCFNTSNCENCYYSIDMYESHRCIDSIGIFGCDGCYELSNAFRCHNAHFSYDVYNCQNSYFLFSCEGCEYCYGCSDQKNQRFMIYNTPYSKEEYEERLTEILRKPIKTQKQTVYEFLKKTTYEIKPPVSKGSEGIWNSTEIHTSKNIWNSSAIRKSEDIRYARGLADTKLAMDVDIWGDRLERTYESIVVGEAAYSIYFCPDVWGDVMNVFYSFFCVNNVKNCFGCIGLRNAEYCILNKQYTKEEYEIIVPKIIEHMKKIGEWGEFFPRSYSHFGYNHTLNMDKYPLTKEQAIAEGYNWSDYEAPFPKVEKIIPAQKLPEDISQIPDDILNWAIECEVTGKPFRIIKPELEFYRKHNLPIPRKHPDERYRERTKIYLNY